MITVCAIIVFGLFYYRSKTKLTTAQIFRYVPSGSGLLVHVDVAALRSAGIVSLLSGTKVTADPEYRSFVEQTRFDYSTDLDTLTAGFYGPEAFYIIQGRFDWKAIKSYATSSGGSCWDAFCTVPATKKDYYISFLPVRPDLMMLAVSLENKAVKRMLARPRRDAGEGMPDQPVWVSIPPSTLQKPEDFPAGTQLFARALQNTDKVTLSIGPQWPELPGPALL